MSPPPASHAAHASRRESAPVSWRGFAKIAGVLAAAVGSAIGAAHWTASTGELPRDDANMSRQELEARFTAQDRRLDAIQSDVREVRESQREILLRVGGQK